MIELTEQQRQQLDQPGPACVLDPKTKQTYILVRSDLYERLKGLLGDAEWAEDAGGAAMEVFREGWDDPRMDVYDELDPRRQL